MGQVAFIYALADPRDHAIRYVGKADDPPARLKSHLYPSAMTRDTPKNRWLRKLLVKGLRPELVVLEEVPAEEWEAAEQEWIAKMRAAAPGGRRLLNGTAGGDGFNGVSREAIERGAAKKRGRKATAEHCANISAALQAHYEDPVARERCSQRALERGAVPPMHIGENQHGTRLTDALVIEMRERRAAGERPKDLAVAFGVSRTTVTQVTSGQVWKYAGGPLTSPAVQQRLTGDDIAAIRRLIAAGTPNGEIAERFGVVPSHVSHIRSGRAPRRVHA